MQGNRLRTDSVVGQILLLDSHPVWLTKYTAWLNGNRFHCVSARTLEVAANALASQEFDLLIATLEPEEHAQSLIAELALPSTLPVLFLHDSTDRHISTASIRPVDALAPKSIGFFELLDVVQAIVNNPSLSGSHLNSEALPASSQVDWIRL